MGNTVTWEQLGTPEAEVAPEPYVPVQTAPVQPAAKKTITFEDLGTPPEGYKPPGVMEDLPPSIGSGAAQGVMGVAGLPGALTYYTRKYVEKPIRKKIQGEQAAEDWSRSLEEGMTREQRQAIAEGSATPFHVFGSNYAIPTMQGADIWGKENIPGYEYEPSTKAGEMAQGAANFGVQSVLGGPKGAVRRVVSGAGAGAGAETLGPIGGAIGGKTGEVVGDISGALLGDLITHKVIDFGVNVGFSTAEAQKQLMNAISADFAANPEMRSKIKTAMDNGENVYLADLLQGDAARNLLSKNFSPKQQQAMESINREIEKRSAKIQEAVDDKFQYIFGRNLRDVDFDTAVKEANKKEIDKLYTNLKALPEAQAVSSQGLSNLSGRKFIRDAMNSVNSKLSDYPVSWGIKGGPVPNLAYWDQVKRELQANVTTGMRSTDPKAVANVPLYQNAVTELTKELDSVVPAYGSARNKASELLGAETSLEGGYKLAQNLASGSPFKVGEFMQSYKNLRPSEKAAFAQGAGRFMLQKANGDMSSLIKYMENPNVSKTMKGVLGEDKYNALYGKAVSANLMNSAEKFNFVSSSTGAKMKDLATDIVGGIALTAPTIPASMASGNLGLKLASGATVATGALAGIALNASERRVANKVVELAFSKDPKDARALSKLLADNYDAVNVARKLGDNLYSGAQKGIIALINSQRDIPSGIRTARKSGGRAVGNAISSEVKRVRALLSEKTASMLSVPDDAIATALHLAKRT